MFLEIILNSCCCKCTHRNFDETENNETLQQERRANWQAPLENHFVRPIVKISYNVCSGAIDGAIIGAISAISITAISFVGATIAASYDPDRSSGMVYGIYAIVGSAVGLYVGTSCFKIGVTYGMLRGLIAITRDN